MSQQRVELSSRLGRETTWAASKMKHPTSKSISPVHKRLISLTRQRKNLDAISEVHTGSTVLNSMRRMAARAVSFGIPWCRMSCSTRTAALTLFGWPTEWPQVKHLSKRPLHVQISGGVARVMKNEQHFSLVLDHETLGACFCGDGRYPTSHRE